MAHVLNQYDFPVQGEVPEDHGYALLSALSKRLPELHGVGRTPHRDAPAVQIAPLGTAKTLRIRGISQERACLLSGSWHDVNGNVLLLGDMRVRDLAQEAGRVSPSDRLHSRVVLFNEVQDKTSHETYLREFIQVLKRRLEPLGILPEQVLIGLYKAIRIKGITRVGYPVTLEGLTPQQAFTLYVKGLGIGGAMGCGVFGPLRPESSFGG